MFIIIILIISCDIKKDYLAASSHVLRKEQDIFDETRKTQLRNPSVFSFSSEKRCALRHEDEMRRCEDLRETRDKIRRVSRNEP